MATVIVHLIDQGDQLQVKFHSDPKPPEAGDERSVTAAQYYGMWALHCISEKIKENEGKAQSPEVLFEYGEKSET